ncbi:DoxX family protein [Candidatus Pacearchaeota archaeon]|nr:MAG: DoxX family protein [Candidatus Pacearchaeota archaeon]
MGETKEIAHTTNWILLGLLMLIPGLIKLFLMGPAAITQMLTGLGVPAPQFFAWVLILSEIVFGVLILAKWKLEYTTWVPIIILLVAAFTFYWYGPGKWPSGPNWVQILAHITLASNYWLLGASAKSK